MKPLPPSNSAIVLRTDFSNQAAWDAIRARISTPVDGFHAYVMFVEDRAYDGLTKPQILELFEQENQSFVIVADRISMTHADHPLLVIDLFDEAAQELRTIPSGVQAIENNLSIGNMDFEEFASAVGEDGVFRGF